MSERWSRLWYAPAPSTRLAVLRWLIGTFALAYLLVRFGNLISVIDFYSSEFRPVGPVRLLSEPLPDAVVVVTASVSVLMGAAFVAGFAFRYTGPLFAVLLLWVTSYRSSWGMVFHTENLLVLHVLLLGAAPAADVLSIDGWRRSASGSAPGSATEVPVGGRYGWAIRAMCVITVVTYTLAGVAKLKLAGLDWLDGEVLRAQIAYDNLRKIELGSFPSPIGVWLLGHRWIFAPLAVLTLVVELGAAAALFGRHIALAWSLCAWGFHLGVAALMAIAFPYPLSFFAYLPFFRAERLLETRASFWVRRRVEAIVSAVRARSVASN